MVQGVSRVLVLGGCGAGPGAVLYGADVALPRAPGVGALGLDTYAPLNQVGGTLIIGTKAPAETVAEVPALGHLDAQMLGCLGT